MFEQMIGPREFGRPPRPAPREEPRGLRARLKHRFLRLIDHYSLWEEPPPLYWDEYNEIIPGLPVPGRGGAYHKEVADAYLAWQWFIRDLMVEEYERIKAAEAARAADMADTAVVTST